MAESECGCPEIGPLRPPSEATSLLVPVTRSGPWNPCTFCPVYKNERFSLRSVEDVKADVQAMASAAEAAPSNPSPVSTEAAG